MSRHSTLTAIFWLVSAAIFVSIGNSLLNFILWLSCMSLYFITLGRSYLGKYWTPSPDSYHPNPEKDTKANPLTRAITYPLRAITYTLRAITGGSTSPSIVHDDLPILALKRADVLVGRNNRVYISSIGDRSSKFDYFDCDAECRIHVHKAPQWDCQCGFYAVPPDRIDDFRSFGNYIFEVELSGVVIETELGYRAQHQKVIGIYRDGFDHARYTDALVEYQTGIKVKNWYDHNK